MFEKYRDLENYPDILSLKDVAQYVHISKDTARKACPEGWRNTDEARRYLRNKNSNLRKMLEMKEGDIILIPKFPEWNMFSFIK